MDPAELAFPLVPRGRLVGLPFGQFASARRGVGRDVAGSRPYVPGDDVDTIDWAASARLSSARASDEFVVREHYAEEAPRVVVVCDRRPEMGLYPDSLPWLSKPAVARAATEMIAESALRARGLVGYLDYADVAHPVPELREADPFWLPPRSPKGRFEISRRQAEHASFHAPDDNLERALELLTRFRHSLPSGSFVFVLSDFLVSPPEDLWLDAVEHGWDVTPVVIQDPTWEQSFPPVASLVVPFVEPSTGRIRAVRLSPREVEERREGNERRLESIMQGFRGLGLEPVLAGSSDAEDVLEAFLAWAIGRVQRGREAW